MSNNASAEIIALENHILRVLFSTCGGHIEEIFDKTTGKHHAWTYSDSVWPRRTSVCFPICGALPDNRYQYQGVDYEMQPHGFLREQIFAVESKTMTEATLLLTDSPSTKKIFPFRFHLRIRYTLQGSCLSIVYEVFNPSENRHLLFSIGSHYAYALPVSEGERLEDYRLRLCGDFNAMRIRVVDGLQSGSRESVDVGPDIPVPDLVDNRSIILSCNKSQTSSVTLVNPASGSGTQVDFTGFGNCVLWAPYAGAPFICIEPWAGMTGKQSDAALEQKSGIQEISPLDGKRYKIRIKPLQNLSF